EVGLEECPIGRSSARLLEVLAVVDTDDREVTEQVMVSPITTADVEDMSGPLLQRLTSRPLVDARLPSSTDSTQIVVFGRRTLDAAIRSATSQMMAGDELLIVFDDSGDAGDTPRNRVMGSLHGTHITFLDDDDEFRAGALDVIRRFARENPGRVGIFRLDMGMRGIAWSERDVLASATGV